MEPHWSFLKNMQANELLYGWAISQGKNLTIFRTRIFLKEFVFPVSTCIPNFFFPIVPFHLLFSKIQKYAKTGSVNVANPIICPTYGLGNDRGVLKNLYINKVIVSKVAAYKVITR